MKGEENDTKDQREEEEAPDKDSQEEKMVREVKIEEEYKDSRRLLEEDEDSNNNNLLMQLQEKEDYNVDCNSFFMGPTGIFTMGCILYSIKNDICAFNDSVLLNYLKINSLKFKLILLNHL